MAIIDEISAQVVAAQKARDATRRDALRLLRDALQKEQKAAGDGAAIDEVAVLRRERKRRLQSVEAYREAGRDELADAEQAEAAMIDEFLPAQLDEAAIERLVDAAIAETGASSKRDMGSVMQHVMAAAGGQADGKAVSAVVGRKLS